ncbi:MAG: DUF3108 domain-containing protein [Bacteroidales bacterium]|nr:DUF3108 domain-containing protein [Bacteroidales bacterium]
MKRILLLAILVCLSGVCKVMAVSFNNEQLRYVISYKWGVIHKDAGDATLSLRKQGDRYDVMLAAKTKPWADRFYMVRDTLIAKIAADNSLTPISYSKITHEKGKYNRDEIKYTKSGNQTTGKITLHRTSEGKPVVKEKTLAATGPVYDMLSVFYYLRALDYSALTKNKIYVATIFSGSQSEKIRIRSLGLETIKLKDGSKREAYHIKFNFTQAGGKKSSDDIDTWISTDSNHIPLYLIGKLPIGEVRAYFVGN